MKLFPSFSHLLVECRWSLQGKLLFLHKALGRHRFLGAEGEEVDA